MKIDMTEFQRVKASGRGGKTEAMIDLVKHLAASKEKVTMIVSSKEEIERTRAQFTEEELKFVSFHCPTTVEIT